MSRRTRVSLTAYSGDEAAIARLVEVFARTATGLALDGMDTFMTAGPDEDDDDSGGEG
jgi:hypothetical protein